MNEQSLGERELAAIRREAMAFAGIGVFRMRHDGRLVFIDEGTLRILDLQDRYPDPSVLVGVDITTLFRRWSPSGAFRARVAREGELRSAEYQFRTLGGAERWVLHTAYLVPTDDESEPLLQVVAVDITERKRAERELARCQTRTDAVFRAHPDMMFRMTRDGTFLEYVGREDVGYYVPTDQIVGGNLRELLPPEVAKRGILAIQRALDGGGVESFEYELSTPNGVRYFEARQVPCGNDEVLSIIRDVSDLRHAEQERLRLAERAQQGQRLESLGLLAGGVAHDFNNILTSILAGTKLALSDLPPDSPVRARLEQVRAGARRAADLTAQLLAYSGRGRFVVEVEDLSGMVREMVALLGATISKSATLSLELTHDELPIEVDTTQIRQVIMNLITNASDALADAPGTIRIQTERAYVAADEPRDADPRQPTKPGHYALLRVSDEGCGMNAETMRRVFEPFFSTKFTGRGLGLSATEGIVRSHGGAIHVQSTPGLGTAFTVLLPLTRTRPAAQHPCDEPRESTSPLAATVLVADDEPDVREIVETVLLRAGLEVELAVDGRDAVERFAAAPNRYRVVLLDMTMPRMNGVEAFRELRRLRPDVRVVLTSGFAEHDALERFGEPGLRGFVQKPFEPRRLVDCIRAALG